MNEQNGKIKKNGRGQIGLATLLTVAGGLLLIGGFIANNIYGRIDINTTNIDTTQQDVASMKSDISWIKSALSSHGFRPIDPSTSTIK